MAEQFLVLVQFFYTALFYTLIPLLLIRLFVKARRSPAYSSRWKERFAVYGKSAYAFPVIWLHAVSVGEVEAAVPLIRRLKKKFPQYSLLITTTTPTGSSRVKSIFGETVQHVYLPYDLPICLKRFFKRFRPILGIVMETEIWPNLFRYGDQYGTPVVIVNARLSVKSAKGYKYFNSFLSSTLSHVLWIMAQTQKDADRFIQIGAQPEKLRVTGNIKFDLEIPQNVNAESAQLKKNVFANRPAMIAASTHEGEEESILEAFSQVRISFPNVLLVLVPRHPERFDSVAELCQSKGFSCVRRSTAQLCASETEIFLGDTLGELKLFYAASDLAFVGGSLTATGGHNVLEPAALGIPVIVGPNTFNFEEITHLLINAKAAIRIDNSAELAQCVIDLIKDKDRLNSMGEAGRGFVQTNRGALDRTLDCIDDALNRG